MRKLLTVLTSLFILSASAGVVDVYNDGVFDGIDTVLDIYDGGKFNPPENGGSPVDPDLVLWYQFLDDTTPTPDSSINANSGVVNGATWSAITNDSVAYLYSFDRVNDYIAAQNTDNEDFIDTNQFSVSTWIRPTLNSGNAVICGWRRVWAASAYYDSSSRRESVGFVTFNNGTAGPDLIKNTPEFSINWSNWNHVVFTYDKNTQTPADIKIYINGKADQTGFTFGGPPSTMNPSAIVLAPFGVGAHPIDSVSADKFYGGDIGEVMYFTNKVLTQADADEIYLRNASGYGLSTAPRNQLVWYEFNTNTTPTPDSSRYGNDGIVNGATWVTNSGGAYSFDGVNDYLITSANIGLSGSSDRTIMGWVNFQDNTGFQGIFSQNSDATGGNGSRFEFYTDGASTLVLDISGGQNQYTYAYPTNEWVHFAIQYDNARGTGPQNVDLYVNGSIYYPSSSNSSPTIATTDDVLSLGAGNTGGSPIEGFMDDWRVYDEAKSATAITNIFDETKGAYGL